jgi:guanosine-3',5'-bis(diphosphate) 3'-pyrophosphohydrolase
VGNGVTNASEGRAVRRRFGTSPALPGILDLGFFAQRSNRLSEAIATGQPAAVLEAASLPADLAGGAAFLLEAYRERYRKVTHTSAFLHPLRAAMVLEEHLDAEYPGAVAAALFHDYVEDTETPADAGFFERLGLAHGEDVARWVDLLTRRGDESYVAHVARVCREPMSLRLKAADVIDNLLDLRAAPENPADEIDLRQALAHAVLEPPSRENHPFIPRVRGEARLYAVWKCFALIDIAHRSGMAPFPAEDTCRRAGQRECLRIAIHLVRYHIEESDRARLLARHARYVGSPDISRITVARPGESGPDGLSLLMARRSEHKGSLESFYQDKHAMLLSTLALLEIFHRFRDPHFVVAGLETM